MAFLYKIFDNPFARKALDQVVVPNYISDNLKYEIRPYQEESFKRYIYSDLEEFEGKPSKPFHLLYNMATGSGKTLVMAGLILYLYEKGYRNFLFFVNSNNIINKTKDNFLSPQASKYLFSEKIIINGNEVLIKDVENFDEADDKNINIKFVSIQMLTSGLFTNVRENGLSFEDFENRKMVLIGDEAHHNNAPVWGEIVRRIHQMNFDNILLEFTATLDYESRTISEKYQDKVIQKYDLAQFRNDKYSKEINLIRSLYDEQNRIIQALILNLYRQELATSKGINLKPVILFKAKRKISESEQNKLNFHKLIDGFSGEKVDNIKTTSTVKIVQKAFEFFKGINLSSTEIAKRIKLNFKEENCLSANESTSKDKKKLLEGQKSDELLNTLENENNPIRAIFAVQKLNEGWDVLNLFDIVRLYEGRDGKSSKPGKTTLSEAQLIGRGARYYPFKLEEDQELYKRKYDDNSNDLKILEELYYHTKEDSKYISELKKVLVEIGISEDDATIETKQLILKLDFKETDFYKTGKVIYNKKTAKSYENIRSFSDLGVKKKNYRFQLSSGSGIMTTAFAETEELEKQNRVEFQSQKDILINDIPKHIIQYSLAKNPFLYFNNLEQYFPKVKSQTNFIENPNFLRNLEITFKGTKSRLKNITNLDYLLALQGLFESIESEIKSNITKYTGSDYINEYVHKVFRDKTIKVKKNSERAEGQESFVGDKSNLWYVYNANYGTSEEKSFVKMFARRFKILEKSFENIYLIRNEREIKIIDKLGRAFEPDFVLFCKQKAGEELTYQVFIEPKGKFLQANDKWKEEFLKEIRDERKTIKIVTDKYLITGVPFYNNENENEFKASLESTLNENL